MSIVQELENVLRTEQEHLLAGDFTALSTLLDRKTRLADQLAEKRPRIPAEQYRDLVTKAEHNEALLQSALRGLQAAALQLRQASEGAPQTTYTESGKRNLLTSKRASVVQKA